MDGKGSVLRVCPCVAYETKTAGSPLVAKHQALICPGYTLRIGSWEPLQRKGKLYVKDLI